MAAETLVTCPHCGANQGGTQFCAECGGALPQAGEAATAARTPPSKLAETVDSEAAVKPAAAVPAPKPTDAASDATPNLARTMMGISAEQLFGNRPPAAKPAATGTPQGAFGGAPPAAAPASQVKPASAGASAAAPSAGASAGAPNAGASAAAPTAAAPIAAAGPAAGGGASPPPAAAKTPTPAEVVAAERPRRSLSKTMMGISPETLGALRADAEAKAAAAPAAGPAAGSGAQPAPASPPTPAAQPAAAGRTNANPMARTMLGLANPAAPAESPKLPFDASTGTMQGLPPVVDASAVHGGGRGQVAKTMLGMAPLGASSGQPNVKNASGAPQPPPTPHAPHAPMGGRTMLGVPHGEGAEAPRPPAPPAPPQERREASIRARPEDEERVTVPPRREVRTLWPLMVVTLIVVGLTLFLVLPSSRPPHVDVSAKIVSTETGEALLFEVPSAVAGSKIRFGGQEKPLEAGRASFALAADSLRVGDNLVLADVVRPDSEPAPVRITLAVFYRIWVDTAALRAERSSLDVVVTAQPGTRVTLEGEELKLDDAGRGVRSFPVDVVSEAKSGVIDHVVHYRVQPPSGDTVVDELRTRIPVAMMQIDRPGREVVTDRDSIEIAGAAGKDTQVHLDKTPLPVKDGRFLYRLMLPQPGEYKPRLVASATGKAPLGVQLSIRRVKDLGQAAAQFVPVQDLTYAKLAPNPAIYKGQKISLEGRVYAVDPRGADSVIQMFVRPCPSSRRCPLWVSDPHATEVGVDAWIRVLGVVQGEQQFRSEKNEIVTVPKVEAQFVLPAAP